MVFHKKQNKEKIILSLTLQYNVSGSNVSPILVIVYEDCDFNCTEVESPKNRNSTNFKLVLLNNSLFIVFIIYMYVLYSNLSINSQI